jgi:hypothetical protein
MLQVRVYLRDIEAGLPGFKQAWDAWIDSNSLPVSHSRSMGALGC